MIRALKPSDITAERLQSRANIDSLYIDEMAERMKAGDEFPPIPIIQNGSSSWLPDGLQRLEAATKAKVKIRVNFISGTLEDARKMALGANSDHGSRRTNADKRHAAELALEWFPEHSDRAIAEMCKVSDRFVADVRKNAESPPMRGANRSHSEKNTQKTRVGTDGKRHTVPAQPLAEEPPKKAGEQKADARIWDRWEDAFAKARRLADDLNREFPHGNLHRLMVGHLNAAYSASKDWRKAMR